MRRNRLIYLLAVTACLIFSMAYRSKLSAILLAVVLIYPVLALVTCIATLFLIRAGFVERRQLFEKNREFEYWLYLKSLSPFGYAPTELICTLPDPDTGLFGTKKIYASISPFGKCRISATGLHRYRGCYSAEIKRISVFDPLRIIKVSRKYGEKTTMIFLPRKIRLGDLINVSANEQNSAPARLITGEKEDFSHVRDYNTGDNIQLVHWKLTAKQDELMIKQFDEIADRRALILCDYDNNSEGLNMLRSDGIIETAIAFAMSASDASIKATVDFGTTDRSLVSHINDKAGFDRFYELMSVLPQKVETIGFTELIDKCDKTKASMIFLVTGNLTEEKIAHAETLAENFSGAVVLAYVNLHYSSVAEQAEDRRFLFINIVGEDENALTHAVEQLSFSENQ